MGKTNVLLMSALLAVSTAGSAVGAKPPATVKLESVMTTRVDGELVIRPDGTVEQVSVAAPVDGAIKTLVENRVREWRFKPVIVDGQARRARSGMRVTLAATRLEGKDGYLVRVDNAIFPDPTEKESAMDQERHTTDGATARITTLSMAPPRYPDAMQMRNVSGKVLLGLRIGIDGRVDAVEPIQSMLLDVRGQNRELLAAIRQFERAAMLATKKWRFRVEPKSAAPAQRDLTRQVAVIFLMEGHVYEPKQAWQTMVRTPKHDLSWLPTQAGTNTPGVVDVGAGESMAVASRLVLTHEVVGAVL